MKYPSQRRIRDFLHQFNMGNIGSIFLKPLECNQCDPALFLHYEYHASEGDQRT